MSGLPSFRVSALRRREHYPNLQGAWGFDEGSGTTARDSSGSGANLVVDAGMTWAGGHTGGTSLANTNGTSGNARVAWNTLSSPVTLMGWARPTNLTAGTDRPLFGVWGTPDTSGSTQLAIYAQRSSFSTSNVLQGDIRIGGGLVAVNHTALTLNSWVHVALTFDGVTIRLFRDGTEVTSLANTGAIDPGSFFFCVAPNSAFAEVDDIRIFSAALNSAQIIAFMNNPVAVP